VVVLITPEAGAVLAALQEVTLTTIVAEVAAQ
jgi:hypothetical protein